MAGAGLGGGGGGDSGSVGERLSPATYDAASCINMNGIFFLALLIKSFNNFIIYLFYLFIFIIIFC